MARAERRDELRGFNFICRHCGHKFGGRDIIWKRRRVWGYVEATCPKCSRWIFNAPSGGRGYVE